MKYEYDLGTLYQGDCLEVLRGFEAESVDSVVTDPPAGIGIEKDPEYIEIAKGRLNKAVEREVDDQNQRDMYNDLFGD